MNPTLGPTWLTPTEAATLLRTSPATVARLCESGNLYGQLVDGHWRIHRDEVARYMSGSRGVLLRGGAA